MGKYIIELVGCDGTTRFTMNIAECDLDILKEVTKKSQETSTCICEPVMYIHKEERMED